jgi:alpha,alpha-trehalase
MPLDATGRRTGPVDRVEAVIFDVDGVVTQTASVHAAAWKSMFDSFLRAQADAGGEAFVPFTDDDYRSYVDGMARFDGVSRFLASRGVALPHGEPGDPPDRDTVCGLGNRKNAAFLAEVESNGVAAFESTTDLLAGLRAIGIPTAAVSASENAQAVLESAGVAQFFDARVDGLDAMALDLAGKPDPAIFLEAARRLDADPSRSAVVEDALAGVAAGRRGGFGLVVGVDRTGHPDDLRQGGADVVVSDLADLIVREGGRWSVAR